MKQWITFEEYQELSAAERAYFDAWLQAKKGHQALMGSIGQLIWFLDDHNAANGYRYEGGFLSKNEQGDWEVQGAGTIEGKYYYEDAKELVDALWSAVKVILKEKVQA